MITLLLWALILTVLLALIFGAAWLYSKQLDEWQQETRR